MFMLHFHVSDLESSAPTGKVSAFADYSPTPLLGSCLKWREHSEGIFANRREERWKQKGQGWRTGWGLHYQVLPCLAMIERMSWKGKVMELVLS